MSNPKIRDVQVSDRERINEINKLISEEVRHPLSPISKDEDLAFYSTVDDCEFIVAILEDIVGYIEMSYYEGDKGIMALFVHPDFRRKGIGDQLIKALILKVKEKKKYSEIYLQVKEDNAAMLLYEKNKFKKTTKEIDGGYEMVHTIEVPA